ncbi:hypothetical protein ACSBR2_010232 [Camellia fascicularis]
MKIQCDVCNKDEASMFCSANEATLCVACDHPVHHANKLAGKRQHRAILCKDCDIPIHKANEHTRNHDRFLLTGVKLSATSSLYSSQSSSDSFAANNDLLPNLKSQNCITTTTTTTNNKPSSL